MEEKDLQGRVEWLETVVGELARTVYAHAFALASVRREFGLHYHRHDGQTLPYVLTSEDPLLKLVVGVSQIKTNLKPDIQEFEGDTQAYLKSRYTELFYWPWE